MLLYVTRQTELRRQWTSEQKACKDTAVKLVAVLITAQDAAPAQITAFKVHRRSTNIMSTMSIPAPPYQLFHSVYNSGLWCHLLSFRILSLLKLNKEFVTKLDASSKKVIAAFFISPFSGIMKSMSLLFGRRIYHVRVEEGWVGVEAEA